MDSYTKGKRWGFAVFRKQVQIYGSEVATAKCDKACMTCAKYVKTGRKDNKPLTKQEKAFYRGAASGFQEFYNKKNSGGKNA